jgi:hypothetical protein
VKRGRKKIFHCDIHVQCSKFERKPSRYEELILGCVHPVGGEGLPGKKFYCDIRIQRGQIERKRLLNHCVMKGRFLRVVTSCRGRKRLQI